MEERTNADDVELEATLEQLALDLGCDAVETDMALGVDGGSGHRRHCCGGLGILGIQKGNREVLVVLVVLVARVVRRTGAW